VYRSSCQPAALDRKLADQLTNAVESRLINCGTLFRMGTRFDQLRQAVSDGNTNVVKQLLAEASAAGMLEQLLTARDRFSGSSVLHIAAEKGQTDIVRLLPSKGALIHAADKLFRGPLHYAARSGHVDVVPLLLSAGANLEQRSNHGCTALAEAAEHAQVHVLQALLQAGAAADTVAWGGKTALILVAEGVGRVQSDSAACRTAELLVAAGAAVNTKDKNGLTALHYAARRASPSRVSIVQTLLAAGADADATSNTGETPLSLAACNVWPAAVTLLLSAGAAADAADCQGETPLSVAATAASRSVAYLSPALQARVAETFSFVSQALNKPELTMSYNTLSTLQGFLSLLCYMHTPTRSLFCATCTLQHAHTLKLTSSQHHPGPDTAAAHDAPCLHKTARRTQSTSTAATYMR
jgi:ankyrin repeat protein